MEEKISRRRILNTLTVIASLGISGCISESGTGSNKEKSGIDGTVRDGCTNTLIANEIRAKDVPEERNVTDYESLSEKRRKEFSDAVGRGGTEQNFSDYWSTTRYINKDNKTYEVIQSEC